MLVGPDRIETDVNSKRCMDTRTRAAVPTHSCVLRASINGRMGSDQQSLLERICAQHHGLTDFD
jgi:hypothetical protein